MESEPQENTSPKTIQINIEGIEIYRCFMYKALLFFYGYYLICLCVFKNLDNS